MTAQPGTPAMDAVLKKGSYHVHRQGDSMKRADTPHIWSDKTGIIALSPKFSVMGINRQACRMLEIAPAPGTDCPLEKIVDPKSLEAAGRLFADAIEKKSL